MKHLVKYIPDHCRLETGERLVGEMPTVDSGNKYQFGTELPHLLLSKSGEMAIIVPVGQILEPGDILMNEYGKEVMVTKIVERRPARGSWRDNPFDQAPDFVRAQVI